MWPSPDRGHNTDANEQFIKQTCITHRQLQAMNHDNRLGIFFSSIYHEQDPDLAPEPVWSDRQDSGTFTIDFLTQIQHFSIPFADKYAAF